MLESLRVCWGPGVDLIGVFPVHGERLNSLPLLWTKRTTKLPADARQLVAPITVGSHLLETRLSYCLKQKPPPCGGGF